MVRIIALFASIAASVEQTGLLQATVGLHNQLASSKVESMQRLEKEWEAKALATMSADPLQNHTTWNDDIYEQINETMNSILAECSETKNDTEALLWQFIRDLVETETNMTAFFHGDEANFAEVEDHRDAHETCRNETLGFCIDMVDSCWAKVNMSKRIISDEENNADDLCGCARDNYGANAHDTAKMLTCQQHGGDWVMKNVSAEPADEYPLTKGRAPGASRLSSLINAINVCNASEVALGEKQVECDELQSTFEDAVPQYKIRHEAACLGFQTLYDNLNNSYEAAWTQVSLEPGGSNWDNQQICYSAHKVKKWIAVIQACINGPCDGMKEAAIAYDPTTACERYVINKPGPVPPMGSCPAVYTAYANWTQGVVPERYPHQMCRKVTVLEYQMTSLGVACASCFE